MRHFILSFSDDEGITPDIALKIAYKVAEYYSQYQIVFAVHEDTNTIHIHFAMNSVSYVDGRMYAGGFDDWNAFKSYGEEVIDISISH